MKLCMFHPVELPMERGWPGRIDGDSVVQLAAQTLQSFFTGGSVAREHAVYPLDAVRLLAPVLQPPSVRVFDDQRTFVFANPAAVASPGSEISRPAGAERVDVSARVVAVVGADEGIGGWTLMAEWRAAGLPPPKDRDFALVLGPSVETEYADGFDWEAARALAARNTHLRPGDLLAGPVVELREDVQPGGLVELEVPQLGALRSSLARPQG